jgi:predicted metal-dependent hydrolase
MPTIAVEDIEINVTYKHVKNLNMRICPPAGQVHISAPARYKLEVIREFVASKLPWIRAQQKRIISRSRRENLEYVTGETHYLFGKAYTLKVVETDSTGSVVHGAHTLELHVPSVADKEKRATILDAWYRRVLFQTTVPMIKKWEVLMGAEVKVLRIRKMKTRWGSCNRRAGRIWLNLELARKPFECLEYVLVHEMVHLSVSNHGEAFKAKMNLHLPHWKHCRRQLKERAC